MTREEMLNTPIISVPDIFPALTFEGTYDKNKKYSVGDVVIKDGVTCVFSGSGFIDLETVEDAVNTTDAAIKQDLSPLRCKCCGGTLIKYGRGIKCEYCDTEYV